MNHQIFAKLEQIAIANCNHPWAKVSCAILDKNRIIGYGVNRNKSHPFQAKYGKNDKAVFLHAEIAVIHTAIMSPYLRDLSGTDLYVCRVKNIDGKYVRGLACPCEGCMKAIIEFDIRRVYFTTDEGKVEQL